jgi:hypothetical protein
MFSVALAKCHRPSGAGTNTKAPGNTRRVPMNRDTNVTRADKPPALVARRHPRLPRPPPAMIGTQSRSSCWIDRPWRLLDHERIVPDAGGSNGTFRIGAGDCLNPALDRGVGHPMPRVQRRERAAPAPTGTPRGANDRLADAPRLLRRTIQHRTTARHCSLDDAIDVIDEHERHLAQGVAVLGRVTRRWRSQCQS